VSGNAITHVLFDLDGVLLDTEGLYTDATQAVVGRHGKTYDWAIKRHTMGRDARFGARYLIDQLRIPMTVEEFLDERQPILEGLLATCSAMRGAEGFVRTLSSRGIPIAVATSSDRKLFELKIGSHDWFHLFDAIVCGDDPRVRAKKPSPDIFLAAAEDLGAVPSQCLVVEDSVAGIEAARAARMPVIAMPDPELGDGACAAANLVVANWGELTALLGPDLDFSCINRH
jgi:pseudouridine-5'-monophosphatase